MDMDLSQAYATIGTDLAGAFSLVLVGVMGLVLVVWDVFRNNDRAIPWVAAAALGVAMVWEIMRLTAEPSMVFYDQIRVGGFASFINVVILGSGLLSVILAVPYFERLDRQHGESYALVLFATVGMIALATSNSLIMIFVGLETMSISLYIMTGMVRDNEGAIEAALKYFGKTDVVGETIDIQSFSGTNHPFKITGVMRDPGENSVTSINDQNFNNFFYFNIIFKNKIRKIDILSKNDFIEKVLRF